MATNFKPFPRWVENYFFVGDDELLQELFFDTKVTEIMDDYWTNS